MATEVDTLESDNCKNQKFCVPPEIHHGVEIHLCKDCRALLFPVALTYDVLEFEFGLCSRCAADLSAFQQ